MRIEFDHVGILVNDVIGGLEPVRSNGWPIGEIEEFPSEGTKEVYIGAESSSGRLLLIEPIGEGPYREAMAKRGPGVHHLAINVDDVMEFTRRVSGSGWYLHPTSLNTFEEFKTVWMARPGVPLLVEVVQRSPMADSETVEFVTRIEMPLPGTKPLLASAVGLDQFRPSSEPGVFITINGDRKRLEDFVELG